MSKTVFFGPFIGEFGWEVTRWQGWVRKVIRESFSDCRNIVCSYPGRELFYPDADEFWPLSDQLVSLPISQRNYITDCWIGKRPRAFRFYPIGLGPIKTHLRRTVTPPVTDVSAMAKEFLEVCASRLPRDTRYFVPWLENEWNGLRFGVFLPDGERLLSDHDIESRAIPYDEQCFEKIIPSEQSRQKIRSLGIGKRPLACVFPRCRAIRRPDKNWPRRRYEELITVLQQNLGFDVAVLGRPGGCYFEDGVPTGVYDFVNIPEHERTDLHAALVEVSSVCLGSISGGVVFAGFCGGTVITWSSADLQRYIYRENLINSPVLCFPKAMPSVEEVVGLVRKMTESDDPRQVGLSFRAGGARSKIQRLIEVARLQG